MRLRTTLLHVAAILATGCADQQARLAVDGGASESGRPGSSDTGTGSSMDAYNDTGGIPCTGCMCPNYVAPSANVNATPDQACALAMYEGAASVGLSEVCDRFCTSALGFAYTGGITCSLPSNYSAAYAAANADAGAGPGVGGDAGAATDGEAGADGGDADANAVVCPRWVGTVVVTCAQGCTGRRTEGICDPAVSRDPTVGEVLATRAYLEEESIHAFARLERELAAHGAPGRLLRAARRAMRDEVRHAKTVARLARRFGGRPRFPAPLGPTPVRSLLAIAIENAREGCVRETYGAVVGLLEARLSTDAGVRRAMGRIGEDESRHAQLAFDVARWILPKLTGEERHAVERAARAAASELAANGDPRIVAMLTRHVWRAAHEDEDGLSDTFF